MWRISALPRQSLAAQWLAAVTELPQLLSQLRPYLRPSTNTLVANVSSDASYLLFESPLSAEGSKTITWSQLQADPVLYATWQQRQREFLQVLEPHLKTMQLKGVTQYSPNAACLLKLVLTHPQHLYVVNGKDPVVLPFYDQAFYQKLLHEQPQLLTPTAPASSASAASAGPAGPAAAGLAANTAAPGSNATAATAANAAPAMGGAPLGTAAAPARPVWPWVLLGLLLLLGLFGLFWWLWQHMNAEKAQAAAAELAQSLVAEEQLLDQNLALQRDVAERIALAQDLRLLDANRALLQEVEAKLKDAERLSLEQALSADTATLKQNLLMQDLVQALLAAAEAKPAVPAAPAAKPAAPAAPAATADKGASAPAASAVKTKRLPKCEVIVKEGKVPQLVMAIDGSGSMLNVLPDGKIRMAAAQEAANALISRVDRNVPIHLLGIQGCPLARDYGVFSGAQRQRLNAAIAQINPLVAVSPLRVLTPLVSAMRGMAGSVPANTDAVGILISDGVDTCSNTRNLDLCAVAREIHAQKPKLKIHVVLVGDDAPEAKCVAAITGGRVFHPGNTSELVSALKTAGQTLERVCE
ncbi:MAG TPA: hypothetical protein H9850_10040 [Candidatus Anaerobiospirillum pullistercoris]|uniref:VWFA domain-containing protein n=1 Tax=Candidatus Anaerobiospirillum pullistercoris TaxID=2838452 RepID=A0A9D1WFB7_9GAMM|nr:hypothetical protein [Candidatus Anaerobiospirillum pullistercoris]